MADGLSWLEAVLLGIVQGLTEWLPVSSSGHLVIAQQTLGLEATILFDLLLHVGTLAVVVVFYRERIRRMGRAVVTAASEQRGGRGWQATWWNDEDRRLVLLVAIATIPTVIIGFSFEGVFLSMFDSLTVVGVALLATGCWLALTRWAPWSMLGLGVAAALAIGTIQGLAIVPGISRSGATIGAALLLGVGREEAVEFSFLVSVPAIAGAAVLQADAAAFSEIAGAWPAYLAGTLAAIVVGYAALAWLVRLVRDDHFHRFAPYCLIVGLVVLVLFA